VRNVHSKEAGREDSATKSLLVAMPTPFCLRKAVSGSDRYGEVVLESPESLARGMLPRGLPRNPRELPISSHTKRNASYSGRYVPPRESGGRGGISSIRGCELTEVTAKVVIYEAFVEGKLEVPKDLARTVHDLYFEPKYEELRPRTIGSLSNAFTSAFKELDPIPQFKATARFGDFLETRLSQSF
jgi:hypothetical protein